MTATSQLCVYKEAHPELFGGNEYVGSVTGTLAITRHLVPNPYGDTDAPEDWTYPYLDEYFKDSLSKIWFETSDEVPDFKDFIEILSNWFFWPDTQFDDPVLFVGDKIKVTRREVEKKPYGYIWNKLKGRAVDASISSM